MNDPRFPDVYVDLYVPTYHAFCSLSLLGRVCKALRSAGVADADIRAYVTEASYGGHQRVIRVTERWVDTSTPEAARYPEPDYDALDNDLDAEDRRERYEARQARHARG